MDLKPGLLVRDNDGNEYQILATTRRGEYQEVVLEWTEINKLQMPEQFFIFYRQGTAGRWADRENPNITLAGYWDDEMGLDPTGF